MKTTVITSSVNRCVTLKNLFQSLSEQTTLPDEIILIEAGDALHQKEAFPENLQHKLQIYYAPKESLAASRERGRKSATGDILLFLDDDIILPKHYIESALNHLSNNPKVMAVGGLYCDDSTVNRRKWSIAIGRVLGIYSGGSSNRILMSGWTDYVRNKYANTITIAEWLFGCNWVIRAKTFDHNDVRIESQLAAWSFLEDVILGFHITKAYGKCMHLLPDLGVIHAPNNSSGRITATTLRMRILYRYIFWRECLKDGSIKSNARFYLGMLANLLLMLKQEKNFWVVAESIKTYSFLRNHPKINWELANEFIFSPH